LLDIKLFRETPELIKENLKKKFQEHKLALVDSVINDDAEMRKLLQEAQELRRKRNELTEQVASLRSQKKDSSKIEEKARALPEKIKKLEEKVNALNQRINENMMAVPNIIHESVPLGKDSTQNVEMQKIGAPKKHAFEVKGHVELAEELGVADFEASAKTSGTGFYFLKGDLGLLNMALINFAKDYMVKQGYLYVEPPLMINKEILYGVYSNAEIDAMSYKIDGEDKYLIATSEHSLIGWFIGKIIEEEKLPIKLTGYSMCFRKEIGSHGIDERVLYRTHQFNKQEMVVLCKPEDSYKYYEEMLGHSAEIFKQLEIPSRVLECCSGDLADLKAKSADLEAWSPRKKEYFEVCSCSNLTDAQARRLNIKARTKKGEKYFVHTLNNTVIATSRAMVAILENNQEKDGTINIPKALIPYMNGKEKISPAPKY
jgi:seryl-tRNA synthetase